MCIHVRVCVCTAGGTRRMYTLEFYVLQSQLKLKQQHLYYRVAALTCSSCKAISVPDRLEPVS